MNNNDTIEALSEHARSAAIASSPHQSDTDGDPEDEGGWLLAIFMVLLFSPLIAFLGAMRWNITSQLDSDLRFIFCWFVDAFLYFLVVYPFYLTARNATLKRLLEQLSNGAFSAILVASGIGVLTFIVATFIAFHYLVTELLNLLF